MHFRPSMIGQKKNYAFKVFIKNRFIFQFKTNGLDWGESNKKRSRLIKTNLKILNVRRFQEVRDDDKVILNGPDTFWFDLPQSWVGAVVTSLTATLVVAKTFGTVMGAQSEAPAHDRHFEQPVHILNTRFRIKNEEKCLLKRIKIICL